jgi:hypothetical protein
MSIPSSSNRLVSLDQFRGYTVAGMFLVNFLGSFAACPTVLRHHHTYCSYADTIMPGFLFAVGFAFRLTFGRRAQQQGLGAAYFRVVRRFLGLVLFSAIFYGAGRPSETWEALSSMNLGDILYKPVKREWYQTLMHIAVTALWITPVIRAKISIRVLWMLGSAVLHVYLSYLFNFRWCNGEPMNLSFNGGPLAFLNGSGNAIDGGPLAFLTWSIPALLGTIACDAVVNSEGRPPLFKMAFWSAIIMLIGYGMSCGTTLYELTPEQVADLKQRRVEQAAEKKVISDEIGPLNKQLEEERKKRQEVVKQIKDIDHQALVKRVESFRQKSEYEGLSENEIVDRAEASLKQEDAPNPERVALQSQLDRIDTAGAIEELESQIKPLNAELAAFPDLKLAEDPVWPSEARIENMKERVAAETWTALLADPPFVKPPEDDPRIAPPPLEKHFLWNYWMMCQRAGTLSYPTFCGGFNLLLYVLFYILNDIIGISIGVFRTFGSNALAGYIAHEMVGRATKPFIPKDAPEWYMWCGFAVFFLITYMFVRHLEKHNIFLRL